MITNIDVLSVAKDLNLTITEEEIEKVLEMYPSEEQNDPTGLWLNIIETCIYSLK